MKLFGFTLLLVALSGTESSVLIWPQRSQGNDVDNIPADSEYPNIEDNLIFDEYDSSPDLYPPKPSAKDYYKGKPTDNRLNNEEYVIDTVNKVLKLNTEKGPEEKKLKPMEEAEIKKLSAAFAKLFEKSKLENFDWDGRSQTEATSTTEEPEPAAATTTTTESWKDLNPVITISKSGINIAFGNDSKTDEEAGAATEEDPSRDSLWDALSKSVDETLEDELDRRRNSTDDKPIAEEQEEPSTVVKFVKSVWNLVTTSLSYIGKLFNNLVSSEEDATVAENTTEEIEPEVTRSSPTTTVAVFALEEPTSYRRLPSEEFEKRGRDVDSLYYGYGIA